jgi:hypothetical protein
MGRTPKPWWRKNRQAFFITINGKRYNLGPDKIEADRETHRLLSLTPEARTPKASASTGLTVADVLDRYLDWCEKHRAARTYDWYLEHIQSFADFLEKPDQMPVGLPSE